jgi:hypothetical protein
MADKDKVVGRALYAEFRSGSQTYQMIITPDGLTTDGRNVPSTIYRRQVSATKPRRAWKTYALPKLQQETTGVFSALPEEQALSTASSRLTYIESSFSRMEGYGYKLYMKPLIIEVSQADLDDIRAAKTPYKILGRVTRVRRALGFGEKLFA